MTRDGGTSTLEVDLHIHSMHSPDSMSKPSAIVEKAVQAGLSAIAVTDHDSWEGYEAARSLATDALLIIPGAELKTDRGDLLALFVEEPFEERAWAAAIDAIHAQGGLAVVPHPTESRRLTMEDMKLADALEVFNSRCGRRSNAEAERTAETLGKPGVASSDAHMVAAIGNGRTSVPGFHTTEELRNVLLKNPVVSRREQTNPILHYMNSGLCFGLKGVWRR